MKKFNEIIKDQTSYDKDENRVKNHIDFEKYNKKIAVSPFIKFASIAATVCFLIVGGVALSNLLPNNSQDISSGITSASGTYSSNEKPNEKPTNTNAFKIDEKSALGLASVKEFERNNIKRINTNTVIENKNNGSLSNVNGHKLSSHYEYPYNYVKIHSAFKFQIEIPIDTADEEIEIIKQNCGLGKLEVIVADFSTYLIDDETDVNDNGIFDDIYADITDTMITIKGSEGLYTILSESCLFEYVPDSDGATTIISKEVFSSHKTINNGSIDKDLVAPYYGILLHKNPLGESSVSFAKDDIGIVSYWEFNKSTKYTFDLNEIEEVSRNTVYSVHDLMTLPENTITGTLINMNKEEMYLELLEVNEGIDVIEYLIHIDENTEYDEKQIALDDLWNKLKLEKIIEVKYDYLYEGYRPQNVYANSLIVLDA